MKQIAVACLLVVLLVSLAPSVRAQAPEALYFPATGHTLDDTAGLLTFWKKSQELIGLPVSEPVASDGVTLQYFERGRLEARADAAGMLQVTAGPVAQEYAELLYLTFAGAPAKPAQTDVRTFSETDHTLRAPFRSFWEANGGLALFGPPISEPLWEKTSAGRRQVQYFTNVRLERDASLAGTADEIVVSDLGTALAALREIDTTPIENPGLPTAGPEALPEVDIAPFTPRPTPAPTAVPAPAPAPAKPAQPSAPAARPRAGGPKSILVNLSDQWLYAYEGDELVFDAPVATGRDGMKTPTGTYAIYAKLKVQTMDGVTDGEAWVVPNVPDVMYFNGGVALHGTYWHNLFGTGARPSHGCVNLPLKSATWLYNWAPIGTAVRVTY